MVRHGGSGAQPCASVLPFPLRLCIHVSPLPSRPRHRLCATAAIAAKTLPLPCITAHACRQQQFDCAARRPPGRRDRLGPRKCEPNRRQSSPPLWTTHHTHGSNHLGFSAKWRWPPGNNLTPSHRSRRGSDPAMPWLFAGLLPLAAAAISADRRWATCPRPSRARCGRHGRPRAPLLVNSYFNHY